MRNAPEQNEVSAGTRPASPRTESCCAAHANGSIPDGAQCSDQPLNRSDRIIHDYPLIDELLEARRDIFGGDDPVFVGYRNHCYRILNFARQWTPPNPEREDKIAICAVFHDIAAWPNDNLDYLRPSADRADVYLDEIGRSAWKPGMRLMIESHHKITAYRGDQKEWVEPIRRADWCDVSFAMFRFGLPRGFVDEVRSAFPISPFYPQKVLKVSAKWALRHPLNPAPIFRW